MMELHGLRQSMINETISVKYPEASGSLEELPFSNLLMPLLLQIQDANLLTYLLKQEGFIFNTSDMHSFIKACFSKQWVNGLKVFL